MWELSLPSFPKQMRKLRQRSDDSVKETEFNDEDLNLRTWTLEAEGLTTAPPWPSRAHGVSSFCCGDLGLYELVHSQTQLLFHVRILEHVLFLGWKVCTH